VIEKIRRLLEESAELHRAMARANAETILAASQLVIASLRAGGKLLIFGNGGSAADAQHLAAELSGRYLRERPGLAAISLTTNSSALTAIGNDYGYEKIFSRQLEGFCTANDTVLGISTSGNSPNVVLGIEMARSLGASTIAFTGKKACRLDEVAELCL